MSKPKSFASWATTLLGAFVGTLNDSKAPATSRPTFSGPPGAEYPEAREGLPTGEHHVPSAAEIKARGQRNVAIALAVTGFVVLVYLTTFFRLAENLQAAGGAS